MLAEPADPKHTACRSPCGKPLGYRPGLFVAEAEPLNPNKLA